MSPRTALPILALALGLLLAGCGKAQPTSPRSAATDAPSDLSALVPADALALVYMPSLDRLQQRVRAVVGAIDPEAAAQADVGEMLDSLPFKELVARNQPFAIVVTMPAGAREPLPFMLVPTTDAKVAAAMVKEAGMMPAAPPTKGAYVAMPMGGGELPAMQGGGALGVALPSGDVALRVDLAALFARLGDDIRKGLDEAADEMPPAREGMPDMRGVFGGMQELLQTLMDGAERLDIALRGEGAVVDLHWRLLAKKDSALASMATTDADLSALAGGLPGDWPVHVLVSMDVERLTNLLKPLMDAVFASLPEDARAKTLGLMDRSMGLWKQYGGNAMGLAVRMDEGGLGVVSVQTAKDAERYITETMALLTGDMAKALEATGVIYEHESPTTVAGHPVHTLRMRFDPQRMLAATDAPGRTPEATEAVRTMMDALFGPEGFRVRYAAVGGRLVSVLGDDALLETALKAASGVAPSGALAEALALAGAKPSFLLRIEARSLVRGVLALLRRAAPDEADMSAMPTLGAGLPIPLVFHASGDGGSYQGGLRIDVQAVGNLVKEMQASTKKNR